MSAIRSKTASGGHEGPDGERGGARARAGRTQVGTPFLQKVQVGSTGSPTDAIADVAADMAALKQHARLWNMWRSRVSRIALRLSKLEMESYLARPTSVPKPIFHGV